ncbi:MAG: hypothetical protein Tsb0020_52710 [Haliangiales bacterium]
MKRRDLIKGGAVVLATVAAGCDRHGETKAGASGPDTPSLPTRPSTRVSVIKPQQEACPFIFAGERLGYLRRGQGGELVVIKRSDWSTELILEVDEPAGIGALADGSLAIVENTSPEQVARLAPGQDTLERFTGSLLLDRRDSRLFAASDRDQVVIASYRNSKHDPKGPTIVRLGLADAKLVDEATATLRLGNDFDTLTALGDGSFVFASSAGLNQIGFGRAEKLFAAASVLNHVVPGPKPGTVWVSHDDGGLRLLSLTDPVTTVASAASGWVYHLASAGERAVAIIVEQADGQVSAARAAVFDATGAELWRTPLALATAKGVEPHWVAGSAEHVAVGSASGLQVFAAATGDKLASLA